MHKFTQFSCQSLDNKLLLVIGEKLNEFIEADLSSSLAKVYKAGPFALGGDQTNTSMT